MDTQLLGDFLLVEFHRLATFAFDGPQPHGSVGGGSGANHRLPRSYGEPPQFLLVLGLTLSDIAVVCRQLFVSGVFRPQVRIGCPTSPQPAIFPKALGVSVCRRGFALPSGIDKPGRAGAAPDRPSSRTFTLVTRQRNAGPAQANRRELQPAGGFMSDRVEFDIVCPNNHNQTVRFSPEEFDAALKSDALVFHCNTCDTDWTPSSEEIAKLRKQFSKNSS